MLAILTAGGTFKADDPLFIETGIAQKAFLPLGDKTMVQWVAEALAGSKCVDGIIVIGLKEGDLDIDTVPVYYAENRGSIVDNAIAGLEMMRQVAPDESKAVVSSSDIPLITPEIVDEFVEMCLTEDADVYYAVVEEKVMEERFPGSNRTFTPMKGGRYAGGDLMMADKLAYEKVNMDLLRALTGERKNFFAQARMIGFGFIFRFIFRMMDVYEAAARAGKVANLNTRVMEYPRAEVAMDVDKLPQYLMVKQEIESR